MACLRERIVADADLVDAGVIFGAGFAPFRGGPLTLRAQRAACTQCVARLEQLVVQHGLTVHAGPGVASPLNGAPSLAC